MQETKIWQLMDLLRTTAAWFEQKHVSEPRLSAELLLAHVLGEDRMQLYLQHDRPVSPGELDLYRELCRKRALGHPVQYLAGEQFFYGKRFLVDARVLIPRPETELVVEHGAAYLSRFHGGGEDISILDAGTGSGCIAITLALLIPTARIDAVDISDDALDVARENARQLGVDARISFSRDDLFSDSFLEGRGGYDMLVSNPPYIPDSEWDTLQPEVKLHEPRLALTVPDGNECYQALARHALRLLRPGGVLCFELHAAGASSVGEILEAAGYTDIDLEKDYSGHDRVMMARK
ncbi:MULTISPECIES: peptide chain release factor N(5)-glutamine methyltransferase [Prosthecochloris]|uniref:Release factor glutamine methyltransferase n=1 Tax=Prosthecochloris vibrioformis TaxID=1098 RepID=A0A5C4S2C4_PROVB|nr:MULTISPECIES: peptide chain release factor N(5)-glutamine methyltransferase [Prosthecochloris]ANT64422.1 Release factor glutamine methyltransferase [Prosthecochloris sp. CIB 2401]TNJ37272.1 peptide chain release factor N(5)-glutamine methyltransferase [Prosthecochloris vibrioformis]